MSPRTVPHLGSYRMSVVLGTFNFGSGVDTDLLLDTYREGGGQLLDVALVYGDAEAERLVGDWLRRRGCRNEVALLAKGCHPPQCDPQLVGAEVERSLDLLGVERLDCFVLHRDRPDVGVDEWADALLEQVAAGTISTFGVSNWTTDRALALRAQLHDGDGDRFILVSNHLSLADMAEAPWPGCLQFDGEGLRELPRAGLLLLAWSSLAAGFFAGRDTRDESVRRSWGTPANEQRRARARALAEERGVDAVTIALAYVLAYDGMLAAVGASTPAQLEALLEANGVVLSADDLRWLETGERT